MKISLKSCVTFHLIFHQQFPRFITTKNGYRLIPREIWFFRETINMFKFSLISFLILCSSFFVIKVKSDVDIITRLCKYDWCYSLDQDNASYSSEEYYLKLFKLFSSGIPQLIYEELETVISEIPTLSTPCSDSFKVVSKALDSGDEWAFRRKLSRLILFSLFNIYIKHTCIFLISNRLVW